MNNRTAFLSAHACDEHGDGPSFAKLDITQSFMASLLRLQALCIENQLNEVRVSDCPVWGPAAVVDDLRLQGGEMVVTEDGFWFSDYPKHAGYSVETQYCSIKTLCDALDHDQGNPLFLAEDTEELIESLEWNDEYYEPCVRVEYSTSYTGGDYSGVGEFEYLRISKINEADAEITANDIERTEADALHLAFKSHTGLDPLHIIHYSTDEYFTVDGQRIEEHAQHRPEHAGNPESLGTF